ncbi:MAG: hypothetical protein HKP55_10490, partial [Gammaproteobacteria bacterium]|nr:hypothetical protein [Gammaproteobacteria bacterium]
LGLNGCISDKDLLNGNQAANAMNQIIVNAVKETGVAQNGIFTAEEVRTINTYIRSNHLDEWTELHGDDEDGEETGFHLIQNDGASESYRGDNLTNTVADGIYHLGFEIQGDNFLNEDGNANASVQQVAEWLTQFYTDHSTSGTGLDRMADMIMADQGLDKRISDRDISDGSDAANGMNSIIAEAIKTVKTTGDSLITEDDVRAINGYIRENYLDDWLTFHGDDEDGEETGFHLVQNDGANTSMFGKNFVNTVADGIYHLGFEIEGDQLLNEDGNANARLSDVADWLNYFYADQGSTNSGLDYLVDVIKSDRGLSCRTNAGDINEGAAAADGLNKILVNAIEATGVANDNVINVEDIRTINAYIRDNDLKDWIELHGDDEGNGEETGFHLVQNDGAREKYRGDNFVNAVIDGIYHLGFEIKGDNILNEDGDANANLGDLATWLNNFYLDEENTFGSQGNDSIHTLNVDDKIWARAGDDYVKADSGDDYLNGGTGNDKLIGGKGDDRIIGGEGNDHLYGGDGTDTLGGGNGDDYLKGGSGNDKLWAGQGNNHLYGEEGDDRLSSGNGKDYLDGGEGADILLARDGDDTLAGREGNDRLIGGYGNDHLYGDDGNDLLNGGAGNDYLKGGNGADVFRFDVKAEGIGEDKIYDFSSASGDKLVINGSDVEYVITQEGSNRHLVTLSNQAGESLGKITVYGRLSIDDIRGTATAANQVEAVAQQKLDRPDPENERLDQIVETMNEDLGLRGRISSKDFHGGLQAASSMNQIILGAV